MGILCCGVLQAGASQASPEEGELVRAICESPRSADGDYSFDGSRFREVSDELASVFDRYRDVWGGGEFCRDYSGLRIYVKDPSSVEEVGDVVRKLAVLPVLMAGLVGLSGCDDS